MLLAKIRVKIRPYSRVLKLFLTSIKAPFSTMLALIFSSGPYHVTLISGKILKGNDKREIFDEIFKCSLEEKYGYKEFIYKLNNTTSYRIKGFNSPETIYSTFIYEDWKRLQVKDKCVLDVGGYVGDTAIYFIAKGAKKIVLYEPYPYSYRIALNNIVINGLQNKVEVNNCAVGGLDSYLTIDPNYENDNSSRAIDQTEGTKIPIMSLKSIVEKYSINDWALKMNCEGCEYEVFLNTENDVFQKFSEILMHYHGNPAPLIQKLRSGGFKVKCDEYIYAQRR